MSMIMNSDLDNGETSLPTTTSAREDVLAEAKTLQAELEQFAEHVAEVYEGYFQEFPKKMHLSLYNEVLTEIENLGNDLTSHDPLSTHRISSSNLPFLHAVWNAAKNSKNIVKMRHPVFRGPFKRRIFAPGVRVNHIMSQGGSEPKRNQVGRSVRIDVISNGGLSWYKVSTITNRRLLFDMAKEAVYCGDSDDDDNDDESPDATSQMLSDVPLVKLASNLKTMAQGHQIRHSSPTPYLVLPRIVEGEHDGIDKLLEFCRSMGVGCLCGNSIPPPQPLSNELLREMVPSPKRSITSVLNIDTSVLVALVSDISHSNVTKQPWFGQSQIDHIHLETTDPLMLQLCPILHGHKLVCTREAASSLARIVHTMGTDGEYARAHLLLTPNDSMTLEQRMGEFKNLSTHGHSISSHLQLPIHIADSHTKNHDDDSKDLPRASAQEVLSVLAQPGRSVFLYGWLEGLTTITCNVAAVKQLEKRLEELPKCDTLPWPSIWAYSSSRPLVGVVKGSGVKRMRKHIGDCDVTCKCSLEEFRER